MLTNTSMPPLLPELCRKIFGYALDAQTVEQCYLDKGEFINNFRLTERFADTEITTLMECRYPEKIRAMVAAALTDIALHWNQNMEKPGPERDLFIRNVQAVTQQRRHLGLDMSDIFKKRGYELVEAWDSIETMLQTLAEQDQNQFSIESIEIKAPVTSDFLNPEYFYHFEYIYDPKSLFSTLMRIAQNADSKEIRFLLNLAESGLGNCSTRLITDVLNLGNVVIEKLDVSDNNLCNPFLRDLSSLIKHKCIGSLHFRRAGAEEMNQLFLNLSNGFEGVDSFNIGLLDIAGSSIGENAFSSLCKLIGSNALIKRIDFSGCAVEGADMDRLAQSFSANAHIREVNLWEAPVPIETLRDVFNLHYSGRNGKTFTIENKTLFIIDPRTAFPKRYV